MEPDHSNYETKLKTKVTILQRTNKVVYRILLYHTEDQKFTTKLYLVQILKH